MLDRLWRTAGKVAVPALFAQTFWGPPALYAQTGADDELRRVEALDTVARQKIEIELRETFATADRQAQVSPVRALATLKQKREQISSELAISEATRRQMLARVDEKIRTTEAGGRPGGRTPLGAEPTAEKRAALNAERVRAEQLARERADLKRSIETIESLSRAGQTEQAQKEAEALYRRHPINPAALALNSNGSMARRVDEAKTLLAQQNEGYLLAMRSVDRSAIMPKDDIEFDTVRKGYFKEITAKRKVQLSEREKALLKALDTPIDFEIRGKSLEDTLQSLSDKIGQPILVDKSSLEDQKVDTSAPVAVSLRNVSARTALRKVLQDNNLTYVVQNDSIQVMSVDRASRNLTTRVYYLGDLAQGLGGPFPGGGAVWGPQLDQWQTAQNVQMIVDMVKKIDPLSWRGEGGGGMGTVQFHYPSMALIVRQTAEFHAKLSGLTGTGGR